MAVIIIRCIYIFCNILFIKGLILYYRSNRSPYDKTQVVENWNWAINGCAISIFGEFIIFMAEIGEEVDIKP